MNELYRRELKAIQAAKTKDADAETSPVVEPPNRKLVDAIISIGTPVDGNENIKAVIKVRGDRIAELENMDSGFTKGALKWFKDITRRDAPFGKTTFYFGSAAELNALKEEINKERAQNGEPLLNSKEIAEAQ